MVEKVGSWDKSTGVLLGGSGAKLEGPYHDVRLIDGPGRFCGSGTLRVLVENPKPGEKKWTAFCLPSPPKD